MCVVVKELVLLWICGQYIFSGHLCWKISRRHEHSILAVILHPALVAIRERRAAASSLKEYDPAMGVARLEVVRCNGEIVADCTSLDSILHVPTQRKKELQQ